MIYFWVVHLVVDVDDMLSTLEVAGWLVPVIDAWILSFDILTF